MKVTTLIENKLGHREELSIEYGLSLIIEKDGKRILFDTGKSGDFINNSKSLDIDLKNLDYIVISHGHCDHSGGFEKLIREIKPNAEIFIGDGFFNKKYNLNSNEEYEYVGNSFDESFLEEYNIIPNYINENMININESIWIFTNFNREVDFENTNGNMYIYKDEQYIKDNFNDEISIGIKTDKGIVVVVGCSHAGIINIIDTIEERIGMNIYGLIGGLHFVNEDQEKINNVIKKLKEKDIKLIAACHCTGKQGETMLHQQIEDIFIQNNTGDIINI